MRVHSPCYGRQGARVRRRASLRVKQSLYECRVEFLFLSYSEFCFLNFSYYGPEHVGFETMWILYLLGMALNRAVSILWVLTTLLDSCSTCCDTQFCCPCIIATSFCSSPNLFINSFLVSNKHMNLITDIIHIDIFHTISEGGVKK